MYTLLPLLGNAVSKSGLQGHASRASNKSLSRSMTEQRLCHGLVKTGMLLSHQEG